MAKEVKRSTRKTTTEGTATATATVKAPTKSRSVSAAGPTEEQIRVRAYEIYQARKGAPGDPAADWAQAERELRNGR